MIEILSYPFMQRALIAALLTGLIAPAIGTYVVQRRLSLLGDGLGHVALAGVGLALLTGTAPIPIAVVACVAGAVVVEVLRQRGKATGDVGLAILFYGGLAAGVFLSGISGVGAGGLAQYLFGSLTTVTTRRSEADRSARHRDLGDHPRAGAAAVRRIDRRGVRPHPGSAGAASTTSRSSASPLSRSRWRCGRSVYCWSARSMVVPVAAARNLVRGFTAGAQSVPSPSALPQRLAARQPPSTQTRRPVHSSSCWPSRSSC